MYTAILKTKSKLSEKSANEHLACAKLSKFENEFGLRKRYVGLRRHENSNLTVKFSNQN